MRLLLTLGLIIISIGCQRANSPVVVKPVTAQSVEPEVKQTPSVISKRKFNHSLKIVSEYDRFKDETQTTVSDIVYKRIDKKIRTNNLVIVLIAKTTTKGQKPSRPETVNFYFIVAGAKENYFDDPTLLVLADGQRINLGVFESKLFETQALTRDISTDDFLRIASSNKVEMQLDRVEFALTTEQLEGLRDFASRFQD